MPDDRRQGSPALARHLPIGRVRSVLAQLRAFLAPLAALGLAASVILASIAPSVAVLAEREEIATIDGFDADADLPIGGGDSLDTEVELEGLAFRCSVIVAPAIEIASIERPAPHVVGPDRSLVPPERPPSTDA